MTHETERHAIESVLDRLAASPFRRRFKLGSKERANLAARGLDVILGHARTFIARRLAPAHPLNDGKQTPFRGHPVFVAQHATATCCRGCLAKWHRIPAGQALSQAEQDRVVAVIEAWLRHQAPEEAVPRPANDAVSPQSDWQLAFIKG